MRGTIAIDIEAILSGHGRVVVLARIHGKPRATGQETGNTASDAWTVRNGTPTQFAEYVNASLAPPAARRS
jgi:ketosteroid isomerase-like protein